MAPKKALNISSSSLFGLKAELSKRQDELTRNKASGKSSAVVGGVKRPDKKPTIWSRQNKGVGDRASRDMELEAISKPTLESARAALERKAKIYDKLRKGKTGGLNDKQYDALLVDFDQKQVADRYESDSEDEDESLKVPQAPVDERDDPIVEYEDEFGRLRTARRSEVPRHLAPASDDGEPEEDEDIVIRNPVNHFPVYEPSAERIAEVEAAYSEANNPLGVHYDATQEVRAKGAGFYQFSGDEETRRAQMEELKAARQETEKTRQETGAVDLKPGEVEGLRVDEEASTSTAKSRATEKRKRELEERRKLVDAKRRKKTHGGDDREAAVAASTSGPVAVFAQTSASDIPVFTAVASADPFAALEAQSKKTHKGKAKANMPTTKSDADLFLAQLEQDILGK